MDSQITAPTQLINVLHRHKNVISDAYLKNGRRIAPGPDTENAVKALLKERLAWHLDEVDGIHLGSKLVGLLDLSIKNQRRVQAGDNIGSLLNELKDALDDYKLSSHEVDKEQTKLDLQECAFKLIEETHLVIKRYALFIERGFSHVKSFELRYKQNKRVLQRAKELNGIFETFDLVEFQKASGADPVLGRIFNRILPREVARASKEFRRALGELQDRLNTIRTEMEISSMLRSVQAQFERDPGFECTPPSMISGVPLEFNIAAPLIEPAQPNIYSESHFDDLAEIASKITSRPIDRVKDVNIEEQKPLKDTRENTVVTDPPDLVNDASMAAVEYVIDTGHKVTASDVYEKLEVDVDYEIWLYMLFNTINSLNDEERALIMVKFDQERDPVFTGNFTISDIHIGRSSRVSA